MMLSLVLRTILHFYRWLLPVAAGVAVCSAVIVGALLVGDSMRGSLTHIAMDRIGVIDRMVIAPRWFREEALGNRHGLHGWMRIDTVVSESLRDRDGQLQSTRVSEMTLLGIDDSFWSLGTVTPRVAPRGEQVVLNQSLADKLGSAVGDRITLKVSRQAVVPADSILGKRDNETVALSRWEVVAIVPDESLGRFSLRSDQRPVLNAFVDKTQLQQALEIEGKINAVASSKPFPASQPILDELQFSLGDLGLRLQHIQRKFPDTSLDETSGSDDPRTIFEYDQVTSDQMLIQDRVSQAILDHPPVFTKLILPTEEWIGLQPRRVITYLANNAQVIATPSPPSGSEAADTAETKGRGVPYSTISGVPWDLLGRMLEKSEVVVAPPDREDWVVINSWLAQQMQAKVGDTIRIDYFLPETVDGIEVERSFDARVVAIAPITEPTAPYRRNKSARFDQPPTPFNDPAWTPEVPGITDQESISNWETPFPLTRKIESVDDTYWNEHRLTPKLFISDTLGRKLFGSRFGSQTSLRFDGWIDRERQEATAPILQTVRKHVDAMGWREIPIREQQLRASSGTTPFDALFLSLSFFVIAAGLLLVAILFRLSIERRADHWGLLMASGWTRSKVRRLLLLEATVIAGAGATLGVALGVGYAYAMLSGLRSWWVGAITVSFLEFYIRPQSLFLGWLCGFLVSIGTTWLVTRQLKSVSAAQLLKGRMDADASGSRATRWSLWVAGVCSVFATLAMVAGHYAQGQAQAGAFVGSGMLLMIAGVLWLYHSMRSPREGVRGALNLQGMGLNALSRSSAQRSPVRSILTVALMASASFLILSMSLFQSQPDRRGTGGFAWIAKSSQGIAVPLGDLKQQRLVLGPQADALLDTQIVSLRMRGGDDASCNNLYQANEPQVIGVPSYMESIDRGPDQRSEFVWFAAKSPATKLENNLPASPWSALQESADGTPESPVPVIIDQNTALWALHLGGYVGERFDYVFGTQRVHFVTVAVSQNTILQGSLWIGENNFRKMFPEITGYRQFMVKSPALDADAEKIDAVRSALEKGWSDDGLSCASASKILSGLLAVQNTYLNAFQVLGALGLVLGTLGLGVAQLRGAMERRAELAAMRAMGFSKPRLVWALSLENGWQLLRGIGVGLVAAILAAAPVLWSGGSTRALASPLWMLGWVIILGLVFCIGAAVLAVRQPLLASLRSDG
jgi:ABC-type lipoprotein release transport system permease subunit